MGGLGVLGKRGVGGIGEGREGGARGGGGDLDGGGGRALGPTIGGLPDEGGGAAFVREGGGWGAERKGKGGVGGQGQGGRRDGTRVMMTGSASSKAPSGRAQRRVTASSMKPAGATKS